MTERAGPAGPEEQASGTDETTEASQPPVDQWAGPAQPSVDQPTSPPPAPPDALGEQPAAPPVAWSQPPVAWSQPPLAPPVGWSPESAPAPVADAGEYEGGPPPFTVGALLSDTFARYGADPIRLFLLTAVASLLSYLSSYLTNPFLAPPGLLALGGLLTLLSLVVGVVVGSATFALLEGGRTMPLARVLRRGVERAGWFFLTALLLGLGAFVVLLVPLVMIIVSLALGGTAVAVILIFLIMPVLLFLAARLTPAVTANVVDNLNTSDAIKVSWRATAPVGVWLRILAAELVLGLLVVPASIGGALLVVPGLFGQPLLLVVAALLLAFLTPLYSILFYCIYRRRVAPIPPSWAAAPPGGLPTTADSTATVSAALPLQANAPVVAWPDPAAIPAPSRPPEDQAAASKPTFVAPRSGFAASALLVLILGLGVGSIVSVGYIFSELAAGRIQLPPIPGFPGNFPAPSNFPFPGLGGEGEVAPGTIAFGTSSDLSTCTVDGQTIVVPASGQVVWMAAFTRRTSTTDDVRLRVRLDGETLIDMAQDPGAYDCLGVEDPEVGLESGLYEFEVLINGVVDARGTLIAP